MLLLSILIASLDILFVGIDFQNKEIFVYRRWLLYLFIFSLLIFLTSYLFFTSFIKLPFFPYLKSVIFMWFGVSSLVKKEDKKSKSPFILLFSSYIDAIIVSISFLYVYPSWFLAIFSSAISVFCFEVGYYVVRLPIKKRQQFIGICYLIIAFMSLF